MHGVLSALALGFVLVAKNGLSQPPEAAPQQPDAEPAAEPAAALPNWFETRVAIEDLADADDFDAAMALGDRLLELTEQEFGPDSENLADAHLLLSDVLRRDGRYQEAEEEVLAAIEILATTVGPLSAAMIEPYLTLGDTFADAQDFAGALSAYAEARNIGRRNFGLLNEDQLVIIDSMTEAAEELGQIEEAGALQLEALTLIERSRGEISPEAIEARYRYARWLRDHRFYEDERRLYFQTERVIREHYDNDPVMTVRVLRERAASYRDEDNGDPIGLANLYEAYGTLEEMDEPPPLLMAAVLTDIGDWQVEFSRTGAIGDSYQEAWELLGQVAGGEALRERWFNSLNEIEMRGLSRRGLSTDPNDPEGYVVVYFTIDTAGRTREIEVTESLPEGLKDSAVIDLMRYARFRPSIVNGELAPARRAYRFEFRYDPEAIRND